MGGWDGVKFLGIFLGILKRFLFQDLWGFYRDFLRDCFQDLWGAIGIFEGLFAGFMGCNRDFEGIVFRIYRVQ